MSFDEKSISLISQFVGEYLSVEENLTEGLDVDSLVAAIQAKHSNLSEDEIRMVLDLMFSAGEEGEEDDWPWGEGEGGFPFHMFGGEGEDEEAFNFGQ